MNNTAVNPGDVAALKAEQSVLYRRVESLTVEARTLREENNQLGLIIKGMREACRDEVTRNRIDALLYSMNERSSTQSSASDIDPETMEKIRAAAGLMAALETASRAFKKS